MPRFARHIPPGSVVHVISRFVNEEFRLSDDIERREYLRRVAAVAPRTDWRILGYALMSSHIHVASVAGAEPLRSLFHPLHAGFARWLNRRQGRLGPVFAERPTSLIVPAESTVRLLAYVLNNPVRAGVVDEPAASEWTNYRAFAGGETPVWLHVELALELAGCGTDMAGRQAFCRFVQEQAGEGADPLFGGAFLNEARKTMRRLAGAPVEIAVPSLVPRDDTLICSCDLTGPRGMPLRPRWEISAERLLSEVARETGVPVERITSRCRSRSVVQARQVAILAGHRQLGLSLTEVGGFLGISVQAASSLRWKASSPAQDECAARVAKRCIGYRHSTVSV